MADKSKGKVFRKRGRDSDSDEDGGNTASVKILPSFPKTSRGGSFVPAASSKTSTTTTINTFASSRATPSSTTTSSSSASSNNALDGAYTSYSSSSKPTLQQFGGGAFAYSEIDTSEDRDAQMMMEKKLALAVQAVADIESGKPKVYRGQVGYTNFLGVGRDIKEAVASAKSSGTMGPMRAPSNVRGICRVDYQPDICKDYKETGQCPFGDSCKFLHDRSEYTSSWKIELEWQAAQKKKEDELAKKLERRAAAAAAAAGGGAGGVLGVNDGDDSDSDDDESDEDTNGSSGAAKKEKKKRKGDADQELPHACYICRNAFKNPIQTQCGHYFCETCAVQRHRTHPMCAVCGKATMGIFNAAPKLEARMKEVEEMLMISERNSNGSNVVVVQKEKEEEEAGSASGSGGGNKGGGRKINVETDEGASTPEYVDSDESTDEDSLKKKSKKNNVVSSKASAMVVVKSTTTGDGGWSVVE